MSDNGNDGSDDNEDELPEHIHDENCERDHEYEYELIIETGDRLQDLAMALSHYDSVLAKQALAIALGTLAAQYDEPCLHKVMEFAEAQESAIRKHMEEHGLSHGPDDDDDSGSESN